MVVLVTGCSSGFGLRIAKEAAGAGHVVYAGVRDMKKSGELIEQAEGLSIHPVQLDITSDADRVQVLQQILKEQGRLDALVNNAGIVLGGYMEQVHEDELRNVFDVNVFGTWNLTSTCLPALRDSGGIVVTITSISGLRAFPGLGAYAATKFALEGMFESLSQEVEPMGVRVHGPRMGLGAHVLGPTIPKSLLWQPARRECNTAQQRAPHKAQQRVQ